MRKEKRMKKNWMSKDYWKYYFLRILIFVILLIGIKYYKQTHPKVPEMISALDIQEGECNIFSEDNIISGRIDIKKRGENIFINMIGYEIQGSYIKNMPYILKPIKYSEIPMKPVINNYESYYLHDTGYSYVLLLKVRKDNYYFIENYNNQKSADLYMISEVTYDKYDYLLKYSNEMEIQKRLHASIDENRYTCFFEQEKNLGQ